MEAAGGVTSPGSRQVCDDPEELRRKVRELAGAVRNAKHLVVYTGAGISTVGTEAGRAGVGAPVWETTRDSAVPVRSPPSRQDKFALKAALKSLLSPFTKRLDIKVHQGRLKSARSLLQTLKIDGGSGVASCLLSPPLEVNGADGWTQVMRSVP